MENQGGAKKDNFVYFIVTHEKAKNFQIFVSKDYQEVESLEKIKQYEIKYFHIKLEKHITL